MEMLLPFHCHHPEKRIQMQRTISGRSTMFSLMAAASGAKEIDSIAKTPMEKFSFKLQMLINSLSSRKNEGKGFYWEHYVPFFEEMKEKNLVGTLSHLVYMPGRNEENDEWLEKNEPAIEEFYEWLKGYKWK